MKTKIKFTLSYERLIVYGYLLIILFGGLLLSLPISSRTGTYTSYLDSVFTATSATCVTGLVVYDTYTHWNVFGQIVILTLIQIGGIGFMTVITLFFMFLKKHIGLYERKLLMQSSGSLKIGGVVRLVKRIIIGTFLIEGIGSIFLASQFIPIMGVKQGIYDAIFHSVSAFCNAGFDVMGKYGQFCSLTRFKDDITVNLTISTLIVIGGLGFIVWNDVLNNGLNIKKYQLHSKIVLSATLILIFGSALLFLIFENDHSFKGFSMKEKILAAIFQSITPRTAGYNTIDINSLSESGHLLTMILMFIGGSPGSTAGGIKTTTFVVLFMGTIASSRNHSHINIFKRRLDEDIVKAANTIFLMYLMAILYGTMFICFIQPLEMRNVLFESISAIGTVGLTAGVTPLLYAPSKVVIIFLMFTGRVGGLTLALVLAKKKVNVILDRPIEKIIIG